MFELKFVGFWDLFSLWDIRYTSRFWPPSISYFVNLYVLQAQISHWCLQGLLVITLTVFWGHSFFGDLSVLMCMLELWTVFCIFSCSQIVSLLWTRLSVFLEVIFLWGSCSVACCGLWSQSNLLFCLCIILCLIIATLRHKSDLTKKLKTDFEIMAFKLRSQDFIGSWVSGFDMRRNRWCKCS